MSASRSHFLGRQFAGPAAALLLLSLTASVESATFEWADPVDGSFKEAAKWNLTNGAGTPPPDVGDNVEFNEAGAYMIELTLDHFSDQIHVSAGDVTLASNSTTLREYLVSSGAADANISGGTLQIGTATNPLFLNLPNTTSSAGLNISVMNIGSGADGFVTVAGLNSRLDVLGNTNHSVGLSGANGALTVQDGATANIGTQGGTLRVGVSSNSASRGDIIVAGGGSLNMGHVEVGTNTSGAIGVINVAGNGSQFVQTLVGANLTLGSASGGPGALQVSDGSVTTGTGSFTVNATGQIIINDGRLNVRGNWSLPAMANLTFSDGVIDVQGGTFSPSFNLFDYGGTGGANPHFRVTNGGTVVASAATDWRIANSTDTKGELTVSGAGSELLLDSTRVLDVGVIGDGTMTIEDGGHVQSGLSVIADLASSSGSAIVRGPGSTWTVNGLLLKVGDDGDGTLTIEHGGSVNATDSFIAAAQGSTGTATVTGNGSTWTNSGEFIVGDNGNGILRIEAGGKVQNTNGFLGFDNNPPFVAGKVTVAGANSEWVNSGSLFIGGGMTAAGGPGVLAIEPGGTVRVGDTLKIWNEGTVKLLGGTIHFDSDGYYREPTGALNFLAGTVELAGDRDIGLDPVIDGFFGAAPLIPSGKALVVQGAATLLTQLTLDGGTLTVGELASGALLDLQRGTLNITNQAVDVQAGGTFGERLELRPDMVINIEQGLTNRGLITGNGTLGGPVSNDVFGEVRATSGNALVFTGTNFDNNGQMVLLGGLVEANALSNTPAGRITGRGTLVLGGGGLVNKGHVALSNGITDLFGDVTNNTGISSVGITVSGNADVTFWDDVTNTSGLFRVAAGSSATFFGAFSGAGISGAGDVYLEADITPGFSPALAQFGGDVHFGPLTDLNIEIGGTNKGAAYDALEIAGTALLDGTLDVTLVGGFTTTLGDVFEILRASDGVNGTFAAESLPQLGSLLALQILYDANSVMLAVVPALPGDFNANGVVDAADYVLWRKSDGTQDGYNIWRTHFGETIAAVGSFATPGSNAQATIVPEPMNHLLLFATPLLTVMLYRRRINSEKSSRPA